MSVHYMCVWSQWRRERVSISLEPELQKAVSHHMDAGIKTGSPGRAASADTC